MRLGDICNLYQPTTIPAKNFVESGKYSVYGSNGVIGSLNKYNHERSELIMACRGTCGKVIITEPYSWINGNAMVIHPKTDTVNVRFLYYQLKAIDLSRAITGSSIPQITRQSLSPIVVSVPEHSVQGNVVEELDLLSSILKNQEQQYQDFNILTNSLFFEYFGDPLLNEKGWETIRLKEIATFKNGLNFDKSDQGKTVRILGVSDFKDRSIVNSHDLGFIHLNEEFSPDYYLNDDDFVFVRSNGSKSLIGRSVRVITGGEQIIYGGFCIRCRLTSKVILPSYFGAYVRSQQIREKLTSGGRGCNIQNINQNVLGSLTVPVPNISLQKAFDEQLLFIENQKKLINNSIGETVKLINATLNKYFG